jgi:hypothetical protein
MGTPHRGADIAYWSKILGKLANVPLLGSVRTDLLKDLEPKSKTLGEICSQFVERGQKLQIFTCGLNDLVSCSDALRVNHTNQEHRWWTRILQCSTSQMRPRCLWKQTTVVSASFSPSAASVIRFFSVVYRISSTTMGMGAMKVCSSSTIAADTELIVVFLIPLAHQIGAHSRLVA